MDGEIVSNGVEVRAVYIKKFKELGRDQAEDTLTRGFAQTLKKRFGR